MSTLMRPHRLLTLTEYEGARERLKRHPQKDWWFMSAFYVFIAAIAVSGPLSDDLFKQNDLQWWAVLILPSAVAVVGLPVLFAMQRRFDSLADRYPELSCTNCEAALDETAVRLTGCCCRCGSQVVELPTRGRASSVGDLDEFRRTWWRSNWRAVAVMFGPMCVFSLAGVVPAMLEQQAVTMVLFGLAILSFAVGMAWLIARELWTPGGFICPRCQWRPNSDNRGFGWLLATGKCPGCGCLCFERTSIPRIADDQKLSHQFVTAAMKSRSSAMMKFAVAVIILMWPLMWLCKQTAWWSIIGWLILLGFYPLFFWSLFRTERLTSCPACRKGSLASPIAIATCCCPRCGAEVLE